MYSTSENFKLIGYTDSDNGGSIDDRKSTSGYTFHFGTSVVSWDLKKQCIVTLSLAEAEYVVATGTTCQVVWMMKMSKDLSQKQQEPTTIFCDNNSAISLSKKSCVLQENQIHRHKVSFYKRIGEQQRNLLRILQV